jgi:hypothetical protein
MAGKDDDDIAAMVAEYSEARLAGMAEGIGFALEHLLESYIDGDHTLDDAAIAIATEAVRILGDRAHEEFRRRKITIICKDEEEP